MAECDGALQVVGFEMVELSVNSRFDCVYVPIGDSQNSESGARESMEAYFNPRITK